MHTDLRQAMIARDFQKISLYFGNFLTSHGFAHFDMPVELGISRAKKHADWLEKR